MDLQRRRRAVPVDGDPIPPGLVLTETEPRGNVDGADPALYTTTFEYYANGDLWRVTTPSGLTTTYSYDNLGRVTAETVSEALLRPTSMVIRYNGVDRG